MSDETIPGFGPAGNGRFRSGSREGGNRSWTPAENLVALITYAHCHSSRVYYAASRVLCELFGREPRPGDGIKLTIAQYTKECVDLIEHRTVTDIPQGNCKGLLELGSTVWSGLRGGAPLTWGEWERILKPYFTNVHNRPRISLEDMVLLLQRSESDLETIRNYAVEMRATSSPIVAEDFQKPSFLERVGFSKGVRTLLLADGDEAPTVLRRLLEVMQE